MTGFSSKAAALPKTIPARADRAQVDHRRPTRFPHFCTGGFRNYMHKQKGRAAQTARGKLIYSVTRALDVLGRTAEPPRFHRLSLVMDAVRDVEEAARQAGQDPFDFLKALFKEHDFERAVVAGHEFRDAIAWHLKRITVERFKRSCRREGLRPLAVPANPVCGPGVATGPRGGRFLQFADGFDRISKAECRFWLALCAKYSTVFTF